ncbi:MAG: DUF4199 domain-containing protein [Bacteroidales bacterium]|nr:DUF4199 domain-containing protein [Bacteroidales bacterium]
MNLFNNKSIHYAMENGLILALYFLIKFAFTYFSLPYPALNIIALILSFGIPFVLYWMVRKFRDNENESKITFGEGWSLSLLIMAFASLPEALAMYFFYQYIDPQYIATIVNQSSKLLDTMQQSDPSQYITQFSDMFKNNDIPSSAQMAVQGIFNNIFFGSILSLIVAFFVKKEK